MKFKAKVNPICFGNILKNFSDDNIIKTGLYRYVCYSSVDYNAIDYDDILDIRKYLIKKNNMI